MIIVGQVTAVLAGLISSKTTCSSLIYHNPVSKEINSNYGKLMSKSLLDQHRSIREGRMSFNNSHKWAKVSLLVAVLIEAELFPTRILFLIVPAFRFKIRTIMYPDSF